MEFKSRFARGLPVLVLVAGLLVPFKPVVATEGPYTAAAPGVSAVPAAQITDGDPVASDELDAAGKLREPGHGKKRHLIAAVSDELDVAGKLRQPGHGKKRSLTVAFDELDAKRDHRKPRRA